MIRLNKPFIIASAVCLSLSLMSCNDSKKSTASALELADSNSSTIFVSSDNANEYVVIANPGSDDGKITVHDSNANKDYALQRVESASGIKYQGEDGYVLWTKGSEFTWAKGDETIAKGQLKTTEIEEQTPPSESKFNTSHYGNYVDSDYAKKDEGYDWVAVIVKPIDDFKVKLSVRSRGDKKRATCSFDAIGNVSDENTLKVYENGFTIVFSFKDDSVTIGTDPESDKDGLAYYCSGGANLAGTYTKLNGDLDASQIDKTGYVKSVTQGDYTFIIEENGGEVSVTPIGLTDVSDPQTYPIHGEITNVEMDDLNNDSFPEVIIYTKTGSNAKGEAIGISVNNGKSMSQFNIPNVSDNAEASKGYNGHDEFAMVEGTFVQRFPIYENNAPTGKTRQIQYKLEDGENMRQLVVDKIVEY
ncbi:MliC family protein [Formosa haliotis]|uniref:MliC family protein n=1 Tax=Formosa haliotis TaxID=1555194 RepID=UPI0009F45933|nr:MliC family protein [Formosa haliotis]